MTRRDERGSIMPMTALLVVVVLGFTAFAVDIGLNRVAARDMQALADVAALDAARALPTCDNSALTTRANSTKDRHGAVIGRTQPLHAEAGTLDEDGEFVPGGSGTACDAVRITAATEVDFAFAPVIGTNSGSATREAVGAQSEPGVCFSAGTKALALNTTGSALGPVLDQLIVANGLDVAGYTGIVGLKDLQVPLADLDGALKVGTGQELMDLGALSLNDFLLATATVLDSQDSADSIAQATLLRSIAASAGSLSLTMSEILNLTTEGSSALNADVNALDLVAAAIVAASGEHALEINDLGISLPGELLDLGVDAKIIGPPTIACGKKDVQARNTQVQVDVTTGLGVGGLLRAADVELGVRVADGTATLKNVTCQDSDGSATALMSAETAGATIVGHGDSEHATVTVVALQLPILPPITVDARLRGGVATSPPLSEELIWTETSPRPSHSFTSPANLELEVVRSGLASWLIAPVVDLVTEILRPALETLLTDLLDVLGIKLGTMDVTMLGEPSCNNVRLAG